MVRSQCVHQQKVDRSSSTDGGQVIVRAPTENRSPCPPGGAQVTECVLQHKVDHSCSTPRLHRRWGQQQ